MREWPDQHRAAQLVEPAAVGHEREVVLVRLAEADAGVEADPLAVDAGGQQGVAPLGEVVEDLRDDVAVVRIVLHRLRRALHVHRADAGAGARRRAAASPGRPCRPVTSLMISAPASMAPRGDGGLARVDRDRHVGLLGEALDDRQDAAQLFVGVDRLGVGPRAFAADVEDVGAVGDQPQGVVDGRLRVEKLAAVGKAVGRDVDDAHQQRAAAERRACACAVARWWRGEGNARRATADGAAHAVERMQALERAVRATGRSDASPRLFHRRDDLLGQPLDGLLLLRRRPTGPPRRAAAPFGRSAPAPAAAGSPPAGRAARGGGCTR